MEFIFILWLLFGIICAVVASRKGRSGFGWFLLGCVLGIFGLIWVLVISPNQQMAGSQSSSNRTDKGLPVLR